MNQVISESGRAALRWALTDGVGPVLFQRMVEHFGSAEAALGATASQWQAVRGIGRNGADSIARSLDAVNIDAEIETAAQHGVRMLCLADEEYPPGLRTINDPPVILYVKGELRPTDAIAVAVVGSRKCTIYGSEQARRFGELLTGAGFTVVSGLARGVDSFAHHGAVDSGGRSIAVMGNGLTEVYPPENTPLAEKLLSHGAWVSELPLRAAVRATNFPGRNRIIAGMSLGTLVIEAAARSGALITARLAHEYNREVMALPGRVQEPLSFGTNALIRDGAAKLITCLEDILSELGDVGRFFKDGTMPQRREEFTHAATKPLKSAQSEPSLFAAHLDDIEALVYEKIGGEPITQDELIQAAAGRNPGEVLAAVTGLELRGLVRRAPGNRLMRRG